MHVFSYTIEESEVFGSKLPNDTWIGMVGQVSRQVSNHCGSNPKF